MSHTNIKKFKAALESPSYGLGWVVAWVPFEVAKAWPKMVRLRVVVEVAGQQFRSSLFAAGQGVVPERGRKKESVLKDDAIVPASSAPHHGHFFVVNKKMLVAAGAARGDVVQFSMWADLDERKAAMAPELAAIFKTEKKLAKWYQTSLNDSTRWELLKWLDQARGSEARVKRAQQLAERLLETMDAEYELPPLIANAFRRRAGALEGWQKMTPRKRQWLLMAVFSYRSPESRLKRIDKVVEECLGKVESK